MLSLADLAHTVTVVATSVTKTPNGDETYTESPSTWSGVLFAPEGVQEGVDGASPRVVGEASLYGDLPRLSADDSVRHGEACCDGSDFARGEWQVVGGSRGWGGGLKAVPIRKTGEA